MFRALHECHLQGVFTVVSSDFEMVYFVQHSCTRVQTEGIGQVKLNGRW